MRRPSQTQAPPSWKPRATGCWSKYSNKVLVLIYFKTLIVTQCSFLKFYKMANFQIWGIFLFFSVISEKLGINVTSSGECPAEGAGGSAGPRHNRKWKIYLLYPAFILHLQHFHLFSFTPPPASHSQTFCRTFSPLLSSTCSPLSLQITGHLYWQEPGV